jgi:large subunit ribosomal protein L9
MKVILIKSVPKIGRKYDVLDIAEGYAMNALFPKGLAERATPKALERVKVLKATEETDRKVQEELLLKNFKDIGGARIEISGKANDKGHLFAGIHKEELVSALKDQTRLDIAGDFIVLDKPLKELGEHKIEVKVQDKTTEFTLVLKALE